MKSRLESGHWIFSRPAAHRGLHSEGVPENSLAAFQCAVENGYPIELDVQFTSENRLVVFHDDNLAEMTGLDADIRDTDYATVKALRLNGSDSKIPDFSEALELISGKVPLMIEIKTQKRPGIAKAVVNALSGYGGEVAVISFDPRIMLEIKNLNPDIIRGQLGSAKKNGMGFKIDFALKWLPLNHKVKPDFISYDLDSLPVGRIVTNGLPLISWTVRTEEDKKRAEKYALNYIFENIRP